MEMSLQICRSWSHSVFYRRKSIAVTKIHQQGASARCSRETGQTPCVLRVLTYLGFRLSFKSPRWRNTVKVIPPKLLETVESPTFVSYLYFLITFFFFGGGALLANFCYIVTIIHS
uniref:Uncharacterized protein n=1 Tax=Anguilla anguilla TaxID=7936 RepID=A0A0E9WS69_ANGAN